MPQEGTAAGRPARLSDRTLWIRLGLGVLAIAFWIWINASMPLHPVPVASRPSA